MTRATPILLPALLLAALPLAAQEASPEWTPEQREVIESMQRGPVGIENDFDGWASGYAPTWTYWRLGDDAIRAREPHMALVRDFLAQGNGVVGFRLFPVDVQLLGDVALVRANAEEDVRDPEGATRTIRYSTFTVLRRLEGAWRIHASNLFYPPEDSGR